MLIDLRMLSDDQLAALERITASNIGTEEIVDMIINGSYPTIPGYNLTPNGVLYKTESPGFLPALMEKMYDDRTVYKKKMFEAKKYKEELESEMIRRNIHFDK